MKEGLFGARGCLVRRGGWRAGGVVALLFLFLGLAGCGPTRLQVRGVLEVGPDGYDPLPGHTVTVVPDRACKSTPEQRKIIMESAESEITQRGSSWVRYGRTDFMILHRYVMTSSQRYGQTAIVGAGGAMSYVPRTYTAYEQELELRMYKGGPLSKEDSYALAVVTARADGPSGLPNLVAAAFEKLYEQVPGPYKIRK